MHLLVFGITPKYQENLYTNWFNAGVSLLGDVLNDKGKIESFETLQKDIALSAIY